MRSFSVRLLVSAMALVVLAVTPADAAKRKRGTQAKKPPQVSGQVIHQRGANLFPAGPVYNGPDYLGDDPDPFIRLQILRDLGAHYGGYGP